MAQKIKESEKNTTKYETYKTMMSKHKAAMKNGFYFEALLIDYAMLEDRLDAFLWAAGVMNEMNVYSFGNKRNKNLLNDIYKDYSGKDFKSSLRNISAKIDVIMSMINFGKKEYSDDNKFLIELHNGLQSLDLDKLEETLSALNDWREFRNGIIHRAMKKSIFDLYDNLEENASLGLAYARTIDNESRKLKRHTNIRKSVKMPPKKEFEINEK